MIDSSPGPTFCRIAYLDSIKQWKLEIPTEALTVCSQMDFR